MPHAEEPSLPHGVEVAGSRDGDDFDVVASRPQAAQHIEPAEVGQVDVEQDELGPVQFDRRERFGPGVRFGHDGESGLGVDERPIHVRDGEVVVDDDGTDVAHRGLPTGTTDAG